MITAFIIAWLIVGFCATCVEATDWREHVEVTEITLNDLIYFTFSTIVSPGALLVMFTMQHLEYIGTETVIFKKKSK